MDNLSFGGFLALMLILFIWIWQDGLQKKQ